MDDAQVRRVPMHSCTCTPNLFTVTAYSASRVILRVDLDVLTFQLIENRDLSRKQKFKFMEEITEIKKEYSFLLK